jgi:hypothetical protein
MALQVQAGADGDSTGDSASLPATIEITAGTASGARPLAVGTHRVGGLYVSVNLAEAGSGIRIDWTLHNHSGEPIELVEARIRFDQLAPQRVLAPGWTTSSTVRRICLTCP